MPHTISPIHGLTNRQILIFVMIIAAIMISTLDIYIPAAIDIAKEFETTDYMMKLTFATGPLSSFLVCIPAGYLSDCFGRKQLYLGSMLIFALGTAIATLSPSYSWFLGGRLLISIGSGSLSVLSGAIIADIFTGRELAKYMGIYAALFPAIFTIAPIFGAQLLHLFGWRSIFAFLFLSMAILILTIGKRLPETRHHQETIAKDSQRAFDLSTLWDRLSTLLHNPKTLILGFANALPICIGALFTFNSPFLFIETFYFTPQEFSLLISSPVLCQFFGALIYRWAVQRIGVLKAFKMGQYPCYILIIFISAMIFKLIPENPYFIIGIMCLFSFGSTWIISSSMTLLLDATEDDKGLTNSIVSLIRNGTIFLTLSSVSYFVDESIIPVFMTMLILATIILRLIFSSKIQS